MLRALLCASLFVLALPNFAVAAHGEGLQPPAWAGVPFALLLLAIALLPLFAEHFWHRNRNKAIVAALLSLPVIAYLYFAAEPPETVAAAPWLEQLPQREGMRMLLHSLAEDASFIALLGSLYTVAGGICLTGDIRATPGRNTALLAIGAVLANAIGTTGASMLLIRPMLHINHQRHHTRHLPVFFIFVVSNLGGLLTPLGDPPLFLGFLNGVNFLWTLSLWPQWLVANGCVLLIFLIWDLLAYRREAPADVKRDATEIQPLRVRGLINLVFLAGIVIAAVLQSEHASLMVKAALAGIYDGPPPHLSPMASVAVMAAMALGSLLATPRGVRQANGFAWGALLEVAILFAGIFVTMVPALAFLVHHRNELGVTEPWQYFWLTGTLSSFLDNAPTYLTFATLAAGGVDLGALAQAQPQILQAISCGAVFMGANTYIGNGPNFMVKAIADAAGYKTPSFFGYMTYAAFILLPVFALVTWLFFV
jgi:Na+/H+ antiporter NhaD/arsenite permease-like protein